MSNTRNLSEFSRGQLERAGKLLLAYANTPLKNFSDYGVTIELNPGSDNVFLINEDYQVAMLNGDDLEQWYFLSYHGNEGFIDDLYTDFKNGNIGEEDYEELANYLELEGMTDKSEEVWAEIETNEAIERRAKWEQE